MRDAAQLSTAQWRDAVRGAGLRATRSRVAVLDALARAGVPRTHAEIAEVLAGESWDRATLYRNLTDLTEVGLLRRLDLGDRVWRFEIADERHGMDASGHPHFLCTSCGDIQCLLSASMDISGAVPQSLSAGAVAIQVRGLCDGCVEA